jgi:cellulose synthase/poly-beta-1,6-N-acetylglucosamine synthase-like glycosyltransferase
VISVIIPTSNSIRDLEPLLASLVAGAVDGIVREVLLADAGSTDDTAALCEDAGAEMVAGDLAMAAQAAKSEVILVTPPDFRLPHDWVQKLGAHMSRGGGDALLQGTWRTARWTGPHLGAVAVLTSRETVVAAGRGGIGAVRRRLRSPVKLK